MPAVPGAGRPFPRTTAAPPSVPFRRPSPQGWPERVLPPGAEGWEASAGAFLFDCCPPDFRSHAVLRRHPVVLARFATTHLQAQLTASADGLGRLRVALAGLVPPGVVQQAVEAWEAEAARLVRRHREATMLEAALGGTRFVDTW
ncbi:MAG TPA: hypothetical protein PLE12_05310 [Propionicimonas sp.]|nr:hypothetical protein [Propionicimonas sp.]